MTKAVLVLEDGRIFTGTPFGAVGETLGEPFRELGRLELQRRHVDGDVDRPLREGLAALLGHEPADVVDEAGLLGDGDELIRRDDA
mgnify:CR=1 FL=1